MDVSISEAARNLGISERTVRRRLHSGELSGSQVATPQGFVWTIAMPDAMPEGMTNGNVSEGEIAAIRELLEAYKDEVGTLKEELEQKNTQIGQLHVLVQQAQAALPAPTENRRSWWRLW